jgi:hypothetical protein
VYGGNSIAGSNPAPSATQSVSALRSWAEPARAPQSAARRPMNRTGDAPCVAAKRQSSRLFSGERFGGSVRVSGAEQAVGCESAPKEDPVDNACKATIEEESGSLLRSGSAPIGTPPNGTLFHSGQLLAGETTGVMLRR